MNLRKACGHNNSRRNNEVAGRDMESYIYTTFRERRLGPLSLTLFTRLPSFAQFLLQVGTGGRGLDMRSVLVQLWDRRHIIVLIDDRMWNRQPPTALSGYLRYKYAPCNIVRISEVDPPRAPATRTQTRIFLCTGFVVVIFGVRLYRDTSNIDAGPRSYPFRSPRDITGNRQLLCSSLGPSVQGMWSVCGEMPWLNSCLCSPEERTRPSVSAPLHLLLKAWPGVPMSDVPLESLRPSILLSEDYEDAVEGPGPRPIDNLGLQDVGKAEVAEKGLPRDRPTVERREV
ncbi:hypothetical protein AAG570_001465 [Ranatra chinensis]|uniref:Uncharacterized protein n=1 Tax=Ranatra chinensis TaxID=642074 RepID=A0ABD0Y8W7_9HEMI